MWPDCIYKYYYNTSISWVNSTPHQYSLEWLIYRSSQIHYSEIIYNRLWGPIEMIKISGIKIPIWGELSRMLNTIEMTSSSSNMNCSTFPHYSITFLKNNNCLRQFWNNETLLHRISKHTQLFLWNYWEFTMFQTLSHLVYKPALLNDGSSVFFLKWWDF